MSLSRIADGQSRDVYDFDNVTQESVHETAIPPTSIFRSPVRFLLRSLINGEQFITSSHSKD